MKEQIPGSTEQELPKDVLKSVSSFLGFGELVFKEKIGEGVLNTNYRVKDADSGVSYFLRGHRHDDKGKVEKFYLAEKFFAEHDIPVVVALARDNQSVVEVAGELYSVYPWVEGRRARDVVDHAKALKSVARLQANIHLLSKDGASQGLSDRKSTGWDKSAFLEELGRYEALIKSKQIKDTVDGIVLEVIGLQRQMAVANDKILESFNLGQDHLIHGDIQGTNIFFDDKDEMKYLFDSEHIQYSPRGLEVARSLDLMCLSTEYTDEDFDRAGVFLQEYQSVYPLRRKELEESLRAYILRMVHYTWKLKERYDKQNYRVDKIFKYDKKRLAYFSQHLEPFVQRVLSSVFGA